MEGSMDWWSTFLAAIRPGEAIASVLLGIAVVMILRGWLVPRTTLNDVRQDRDTWKEAALKSAEAGRVKDAQISELIEHSRTTAYAFRSLPGGDDVGQTAPPARGT